MTTKIKELNLLDVEDIEGALSEYFEREIKLSEVECNLVYCVPIDGGGLCGSYLQFFAGDDECSSYDLFEDEDESYPKATLQKCFPNALRNKPAVDKLSVI